MGADFFHDEDDTGDEDDFFFGDTLTRDPKDHSVENPVDNAEIETAPLHFFGHEQNRAHCLSLLAQGKMPHGLILTGPKGVGKYHFAMGLARTLLAHVDQSGDGSADETVDMFGDNTPSPKKESVPEFDILADHPVARLIASGAHPDFLSLGTSSSEEGGEEGKSRAIIPVDAVRKVTQFLRLMPSMAGGWRVVVIDNADTMNRNAQNALLKILEEPPPRTVLMLITHQAGRLLPTIRSRTRCLPFSALSPSDFAAALKNMGITLSGAPLKWVMTLSNGCPGVAATWADPQNLTLIQDFLALWHNFPSYDEAQWQIFTEKMAGKKEEGEAYSFILFLWSWMAQTCLHAKVDSAARASFLELVAHPVFGKMIETYSLATWIDLCDRLTVHFEKLKSASLEKRQGLYSARLIMAGQIV